MMHEPTSGAAVVVRSSDLATGGTEGLGLRVTWIWHLMALVFSTAVTFALLDGEPMIGILVLLVNPRKDWRGKRFLVSIRGIKWT